MFLDPETAPARLLHHAPKEIVAESRNARGAPRGWPLYCDHFCDQALIFSEASVMHVCRSAINNHVYSSPD